MNAHPAVPAGSARSAVVDTNRPGEYKMDVTSAENTPRNRLPFQHFFHSVKKNIKKVVLVIAVAASAVVTAMYLTKL